MFTDPKLVEIRDQYLAGEINDYEAQIELYTVSMELLTDPRHDKSPVGRLLWVWQMMSLLVDEKAGKVD